MSLIPASTLPVDPTGLSYEEGEQTVDPRDQLTPGMCRITNGEDVLEDISGMTGDQQRDLYNNMLLDPRWYKWMLQTGVKRFGKPRYWQIGQLHQDKWPGSVTNYPKLNGTSDVEGTFQEHHTRAGASTGAEAVARLAGSSMYGLFQTGHRGVLGWMPTDAMQDVTFLSSGENVTKGQPMIASPPEIELFKILMPPMHKTNYYYRMFITETVYFKDPVVMNLNGYRPIDVFHINAIGLPKKPTTDQTGYSDATLDGMTGGNYGSD